jgi:hypothetical protein
MSKVIRAMGLAVLLAGCSQASDKPAGEAPAPTPTPAAEQAVAPDPVVVADRPDAEAGKTARCEISHAGYDDQGARTKGRSYEGPCLFSAEKGGHFTVSLPGGRPFWTGDDAVTKISVGVDGDAAQVTGMTPDAMARWGYAKRVQTDRACWAGDDFTVCAR